MIGQAGNDEARAIADVSDKSSIYATGTVMRVVVVLIEIEA